MAASKLFSLLGPSILRTNSSTFVPPPHHLIPRVFFLRSSQRRCRSSSFSALTIDSDDTHHAFTTNESSPPHPWPEWVSFVDRLKSKGYLTPKENEPVYVDMKAVKDACLSFARHHFHIFKSLSTEDIQTVVGKGCPNLLRKAVNSAKRLREYVQLDESDVCGACDLRGSCDRAYVMLSESEPARTVDIVRILLFYALDPVVMSGGSKPPGGELVEASVRKLLSELIELGEITFDPKLLQPASVTATRKKKPLNLSNNGSPKEDQMKPGDWVCPGCNYMNFTKNIQCLRCKADNPIHKAVPIHTSKPTSGVVNEIGDWDCPQCNFMNFAKNIRCLKCRADNPTPGRPTYKGKLASEMEKKPGDWDCPQCSFMNFSSKKQCFRCSEPRPVRELRPGEWECPKCDFLNFRRNTSCKKCQHGAPETSMQHDVQAWKRPY